MSNLFACPLMDCIRLQQQSAGNRLQWIDARFFLPTENRSAAAEFEAAHLPNAIFFDIDAISDPCNPLPHMLPSPEDFRDYMDALGINSDEPIVCYDDGRFMGACRAWWTFRTYGHSQVVVLDGGLPAWQAAGLPIATGANSHPPARRHPFTVQFHPERIASLNTVKHALEQRTAQVIDARSADRFNGRAPEPRPGLRSGHMPGAINLPFTALIADNGRLASTEQIRHLFTAAGIDLDQPIISSCGSGVSAAVLLLALELLGCQDLALYDGSWTEWASRDEAAIAETLNCPAI